MCKPDPQLEESSFDSIDEFSLVPSEEINDQVSKLCEAVERMRTTINSQPSGVEVLQSCQSLFLFLKGKSARVYTSSLSRVMGCDTSKYFYTVICIIPRVQLPMKIEFAYCYKPTDCSSDN